MLLDEPQLLVDWAPEIPEVLLGGTDADVGVRAESVLVVLPAGDGVVLEGREGDEVPEGVLEVFGEQLVGVLVGIEAAVAGHEEHEKVGLGRVGEHVAFLVLVVEGGVGEEVEDPGGVVPEGLVQAHKELVEHAEADLLDGGSVVGGEGRGKGDFVVLQHSQRHAHQQFLAVELGALPRGHLDEGTLVVNAGHGLVEVDLGAGTALLEDGLQQRKVPS